MARTPDRTPEGSEAAGRDPRRLALDVLARARAGAFLAPTLSSALDGVASPRDRAFLTDLAYGAARRRIALDAALAPLLREPERLPDDVRDALRLGAWEILHRGTPRRAAVHAWVGTVKRLRGGSAGLAGLVNAVLRRVEPPPAPSPAERVSLPAWLWERFEADLGDDAERAAAGMLEPEPLWLAAHGPGGEPRPAAERVEAALDALRTEGAEAEPGPVPGSIRARLPGPLHASAAYRAGLVQPQNPASIEVARLAGARTGERALDLASGNGVKAALLAAAGARVTSVEVDRAKLRRARRNLERLGLEAEALAWDLTAPPPLEPAPVVLLDAPCSGTGTLRGHPEIKERLAPEDVTALAALQARMLEVAADLVAPGGSLTYAVCALSAAEGPERVAALLAERPDLEARPIDTPLPARPAGAGAWILPVDGLDGFFVARLERAR